MQALSQSRDEQPRAKKPRLAAPTTDTVAATAHTKTTTRHITRAQEHRLLGRQDFKCANRPDSAVRRYLQEYVCLLWHSKRNGVFDASGFECDHDVQWSSGMAGVNDDANLQLFCPNCHRRKTQIDQEREARVLATHRDQLDVDVVHPTTVKPGESFATLAGRLSTSYLALV